MRAAGLREPATPLLWPVRWAQGSRGQGPSVFHTAAELCPLSRWPSSLKCPPLLSSTRWNQSAGRTVAAGRAPAAPKLQGCFTVICPQFPSEVTENDLVAREALCDG